MFRQNMASERASRVSSCIDNLEFLNYVLPSSDLNFGFREDGENEDEFEEFSKKNFINVLASTIRDIKEIQKNEILEKSLHLTPNSLISDLCDPLLPDILNCGKIALLKLLPLPGITILAEKPSSSGFSQESSWNPMIIDLGENKNSIYQTINHTIRDRKMNSDVDEVLKEFSEFNAVVPVFSPVAAKILKPLIQTGVFASLCSYSIFRNPRIVYPFAHFSTLLSVWVKLNKLPKPSERDLTMCQSVFSTAAAYLDLPLLKTYKELLFSAPMWALEEKCDNDKGGDDNTFVARSENLEKPLFFICTYRDSLTMGERINLVILLVREYCARLISRIANRYSLSFANILLFTVGGKKMTNTIELLAYGEELFVYYYKLINKLESDFQKDFPQNFSEKMRDNMTPTIELFREYCQSLEFDFSKFVGLNEEILFGYKFTNVFGIGNFDLTILKDIALRELKIPEDFLNEILSAENLFRFLFGGLKRSKNTRQPKLMEEVISYKDAVYAVTSEINSYVKKDIVDSVVERILSIPKKSISEIDVEKVPFKIPRVSEASNALVGRCQNSKFFVGVKRAAEDGHHDHDKLLPPPKELKWSRDQRTVIFNTKRLFELYVDNYKDSQCYGHAKNLSEVLVTMIERKQLAYFLREFGHAMSCKAKHRSLCFMFKRVVYHVIFNKHDNCALKKMFRRICFLHLDTCNKDDCGFPDCKLRRRKRHAERNLSTPKKSIFEIDDEKVPLKVSRVGEVSNTLVGKCQNSKVFVGSKRPADGHDELLPPPKKEAKFSRDQENVIFNVKGFPEFHVDDYKDSQCYFAAKNFSDTLLIMIERKQLAYFSQEFGHAMSCGEKHRELCFLFKRLVYHTIFQEHDNCALEKIYKYICSLHLDTCNMNDCGFPSCKRRRRKRQEESRNPNEKSNEISYHLRKRKYFDEESSAKPNYTIIQEGINYLMKNQLSPRKRREKFERLKKLKPALKEEEKILMMKLDKYKEIILSRSKLNEFLKKMNEMETKKTHL